MENNCQHGESCLLRASSTLLARGEGFKQLTGPETWKSRGAAVSTLLEPNLLVQSCVKNVRDLFQALSRCGFTSVNPFTHRSSAVRLPHAPGRAGCLVRPCQCWTWQSFQGLFWVKHPQNLVVFTSFCLQIGHDLPVLPCGTVSVSLSIFSVFTLPCLCTLITRRMLSVESHG